ncbi:MAG TPA: dethiobiotin synthase [Verrucomicrobiae bacterium]|jgi:dethiobiotin synthetase|nr:dethiobiotin synthase [Verrucomicrobiae bacterium]
MRRILFVTGTDTGAGKTVLTVLLARHLRAQDVNAAALKPICSGGRGDARKIYGAINGVLSLDEINPWHFKAAIAPSLAARREGKKLKLPQVVAHARAMQKRFEVLLMEGAGGLLSPLGDKFNSRDLILQLDAIPIIVAPNRLGVVNHALLTLDALPANFRARARVVLFPFGKPDASAKSNAGLLAECFDAKRIFTAGVPEFAGKLFEGLL